jgi:hypothetical protein
MTITRLDWRLYGDLIEYLIKRYPGCTHAQYEAALRLITSLGATDEVADQVEVLLDGCKQTEGES